MLRRGILKGGVELSPRQEETVLPDRPPVPRWLRWSSLGSLAGFFVALGISVDLALRGETDLSNLWVLPMLAFMVLFAGGNLYRWASVPLPGQPLGRPPPGDGPP